ncbi:TolC family protein [bacterium]|nr:TolC family protein [bacterium]
MRCYGLVFLILSGILTAAGPDPVLDNYIQLAVENNLALKQKEFSLKESTAALKEARGMYLPSVGIEARYSRAGGGREISIPVGDLMNPVYGVLKDLYSRHEISVDFPDLPNMSEPFLREKEHETKLRVIQPLFQPAIHYNAQIRRELRDIQAAEKNIFTRALIADVKTAYYNVMKTRQIVILLSETADLLEENVRVSQSLFRNDMVTQAVVFRSEAELHAFRQMQAETEQYAEMARAYFNFLLNRPMDSGIEITDHGLAGAIVPVTLEEGQTRALNQREELIQLEDALAITDHQVNMNRSRFLPGVSAVIDYGYQGAEYEFSKKDDYWMANLVASWNLFDGFQDKYRIDQARFRKKQAQTQLEEVQQKIRLQVLDCYHGLNVALKNIDTGDSRKKAAQKSFQIVQRQYKEGMSSLIEYIDARNTWSRAEVDAITAIYEYYIQLAEYEKVTADFPLQELDN